MRILVVDDEVQVARSIERVLRRHGYDVRTAHSGADALAQLDGVGVMLTDLRMAGMSGIELAHAVKRTCPEVRCCLMSGDGGALGGIEGADITPSQIDARLGKPFANSDLLEVVARLSSAAPRSTS